MSLKQSVKMNNELLKEKLIKVESAIKELEKKEALIENMFRENRNEIEKYYDEKISKLGSERDKKLNLILENERIQLKKIFNKKNPNLEIKNDIKEKFKLFDIKKKLNEEIEIKYNGWCREEIEILKIEDLNLIKIGSFIGRNKKEVNKYDLRIDVYYKNDKLKDYIKSKDWQGLIIEKSFKTKDEVKGYFERNYNKIIEDYKKEDLELFEKINEIEINLNDEFDFNLIKAYSNQWKLESKEKNKASFIYPYDVKSNFEVEYLGENKFKISNEENKRELELSLEYSVYNLTT